MTQKKGVRPLCFVKHSERFDEQVPDLTSDASGFDFARGRPGWPRAQGGGVWAWGLGHGLGPKDSGFVVLTVSGLGV